MRRATIGLLLAVGPLIGCTPSRSGGLKGNNDPLLGATTPSVNATPLATNPAATAGNPASALPPLAQASPTSTAVLAGGAYPSLNGGQDLRIGTAPASAGGNRIQPPHQNPRGVIAVVTADPNPVRPADHSAPGVIPMDATGTRPTSSPNAPAWTSVGNNLEQAMNRLTALNPKWHKLENVGPSTWRFSCSIPDRAEPNKSRTYEVEAPTAAQAVQNALDRISQN